MVDAVQTGPPRAGTGDDEARPRPTTGPEETARGSEVLEAVAFAAERFLRATRWRDVAGEVLERLGAAAAVSRAYIVENGTDGDGHLTATWIAEWCDAGVARLSEDRDVATARWDTGGFARWAEMLERGESVVGPTHRMHPDERAVLERHGVVSVASVPVVVDGTWWGAIGFDHCGAEHGWAGSRLDALGAASTLLSAAIERELRDERLRSAEERYRTFIETIPAVTYTDVIGADGARLGYVSPQIQEILGYPQQAFLDEPGLWFRVMHPDDLADLEARDAFANDDDRPFDEEYRMIAADGRTVWVHDTSLAVKADDGSIAYFQGFLTDVTARRNAQDALDAAQERFRTLVEQMPVVVYSQTVEPGTTRGIAFDYVSPLVTDVLGLRPEQMIGEQDPWSHLVHADDVAAARAIIEQTDASGEPMSLEYRVVRPDGNTIWIHEEAVLIRDARGVPTHWQGFLLDLTDRIAAAEQVRVAEERFRAIVEHTPAISYQEVVSDTAYDATSTIAYVSPQIESVLGYTRRRVGDPGVLGGVTHPDDLPAVLEIGGESNASGQPYRQDYRMRAKDGRWVWFHDESHVIRDADGTPLFWQGVMVDITERKLAEQALEATERRLRALVEHIPAVVYTQSVDGASEDFWISPQVERDLRLHRRGVGRDRRLLGGAPPSGGPRAGPGRGRGDRRGARAVPLRVPVPARPMAPTRGCSTRPCSCRTSARADVASGKGSCSTSPGAARPRTSSATPSACSVRRSSTCRRSSIASPRARSSGSTSAPGRGCDRMDGAGVDRRPRLLARPHPSRGRRPGHRGERADERDARALLGRVPLPAQGRVVDLAPRRGDVHPRAERDRVLAGLHVRRDRAQARRGAAPRGRREVPNDRRAEPSDLLHPGDRRGRPDRVAHDLHRPGQHRPDRLLARRRSRTTLACGAGSSTPTIASGSSVATRSRTPATTTSSRWSTG